MSTEVGETQVTEEVVTEEVVESTEPTPPELPSDTPEFEVPEKFKGKSVEDVIKSYQELEKFKGKPTEETTEEPTTDKKEELHSQEDTAKYKEYVDYYKENGSLTDEQYEELAKRGYDKTIVDEEIEYYNYRHNKNLDSVLEPLGGGQDKFKEVAQWANQNKPAEEVTAFNDALAAAPKIAQQAMLRGLYAEFEDSNTPSQVDGPIHTNAAQAKPSSGYKNETEFFNDMNNPAYKNDRLYAKQVEEKLSRSNTSEWSF